EPGLDLRGHFLVLFQEGLGVFAALAEPLAAVGEPGPALLDDVALDALIDQVTLAGDPFAVHHVEFRFAERRCHLVLHDLRTRPATDHRLAVLDGADASNVDADRGIELQRAAAGRGFRVTEHDPDFFAELIDEDQTGLGLRDDAGELTKRL